MYYILEGPWLHGYMVTVSKEDPPWLGPTGEENFGFLTF